MLTDSSPIWWHDILVFVLDNPLKQIQYKLLLVSHRLVFMEVIRFVSAHVIKKEGIQYMICKDSFILEPTMVPFL